MTGLADVSWLTQYDIVTPIYLHIPESCFRIFMTNFILKYPHSPEPLLAIRPCRSQLVLVAHFWWILCGFYMRIIVSRPTQPPSRVRRRRARPWHGIIRCRIARCRASGDDRCRRPPSRPFQRHAPMRSRAGNLDAINARWYRVRDAGRHVAALWPVHHYRYRGDIVSISEFAAAQESSWHGGGRWAVMCRQQSAGWRDAQRWSGGWRRQRNMTPHKLSTSHWCSDIACNYGAHAYSTWPVLIEIAIACMYALINASVFVMWRYQSHYCILPQTPYYTWAYSKNVGKYCEVRSIRSTQKNLMTIFSHHRLLFNCRQKMMTFFSPESLWPFYS